MHDLKADIGDLKTDIEYLKTDTGYLKKKVGNLDVAMNGPDNSPRATGMKHEVGQNSRFRINMTRAFWIILSGELTIIFYLITQAIAS